MPCMTRPQPGARARLQLRRDHDVGVEIEAAEGVHHGLSC